MFYTLTIFTKGDCMDVSVLYTANNIKFDECIWDLAKEATGSHLITFEASFWRQLRQHYKLT